MATQMGSRMVFENAKTLVRSLGYSVEHAKLTQSYLRSEVAISTSIANYHIPVLVNDNQNASGPRVNEKRLNLQDIFITTEIAVLIGVGDPTETRAKLYTYPNATAFAGAAADLWSLYNGYLNLTINNEQVLPAWDVLRHYYVPQTQQDASNIDQWAASSDAFYPVEPGIVMNGAANINFQLTANGAPATNLFDSFICVIQRGILCQNVTTVK